MMHLAAVFFAIVLLSWCGVGCGSAVQSEPSQFGGQCFGMRPMCPIGLRPACICYDAMGNNCSWQCVR